MVLRPLLTKGLPLSVASEEDSRWFRHPSQGSKAVCERGQPTGNQRATRYGCLVATGLQPTRAQVRSRLPEHKRTGFLPILTHDSVDTSLTGGGCVAPRAGVAGLSPPDGPSL